MSDKKTIKNGVIIVLEGNDGTGKTTIANKLMSKLSQYYDNGCMYIREPGGDVVNDKIRELILYNELEPLTELLLFNANRRNNVINHILPGLRDGNIIIMDRFIDSTYIYQSMNNSYEDISTLTTMIMPEEFDEYPCLKILIHCDTQVIMNRLNNDGREHNKYDEPDRMRLTDISNRYIKRFLWLQNNGANARIITGDRDVDDVFKDVLDLVVNFTEEYC